MGRKTSQAAHASRRRPRAPPQLATMHTHLQHAMLAALLACALAASSAGAQPAEPQGYAYGDVSGQQVHVSTTMIVLLAAVVGVFVFIAVSTIYLRHCTGYPAVESGDVVVGRRSVLPANSFVSRRQRRQRGLDSSVIRMFPTMKYAEAKALRVGKVTGAALECAVCLSEFDDDEMLRFLPKCSHAFHPDCIGQWLASHVTCPVCRRNLDPNKDTTEELIIPAATAAAARETNSTSSEIVVVRQEDGVHGAALVIDVVTEEDEEERRKEELELQEIGTQLRAMRSRSGRQRPKTAKLLRSHSTGHSLAIRLDRDLERFTLRLPEHVHREMVAAGEKSVRRGRRVAEGITLGASCSPRFARSSRWPSFLPSSLSGKLSFLSPSSRRTPESTQMEVSSSSSSSATKVKGKRVAAIDVADGSAHATAHPGCTVASSAAAVAVDVEKAATRRRMHI